MMSCCRCSPLKTWVGASGFRRSYRWTLWSAEPTAISCAEPGLYLTQQTLARSSIDAVGAACLEDHACTRTGLRTCMQHLHSIV